MSIDNIVNVQISRDTSSVSRAGFGTPLILGTNKGFDSLSKVYTNYNDVLLDFSATDPEALAASAVFSQTITVKQLLIGRRATSDLTVVTVDEAVDSVVYSCTINGTVFSINSGVSATPITIAAALVSAINLGSEPVTATDNLDGTYDLVADVASTPYSVKVNLNQSMVFVTSDTVANDLAAISQQNNTWYGLVMTSRVPQDQLDAAAYIETQSKIFFAGSADSDIADTTDASDITTVAAIFKSLGYARSAVFYHPPAATEYIEAAMFGVILPLDPGAYTAALKDLVGITKNNITATQRTNILAKNANMYSEVGGVGITEFGTVGEGEYIDIIILVDWLDARITEGVFSLLSRLPKVPYTDAGIAAIEAEITKVLQLGQSLGGIAFDPPFVVTVPLAADIPVGDKAARVLNGISFVATLTGAIHATNITGTVTL